MPKMWCPGCKEEKIQIIRLSSVRAVWDEDEDDYVSSSLDNLKGDYWDKCPECGAELEEN